MKRMGYAGMISCVLLLWAIPMLAWATQCPVPEEKLHEAVLAWGRERSGQSNGEWMAEGHIVLGCEETETTVEVYAVIRYQYYGFMAGIFTDMGSGCGMLPVKMTFTKPNDELIGIQEPEGGMHYGASIREMLPDDIENDWGGNERDALLRAQMDEQARAYVQSIGRTETVMDWRTLDPPLELADALVIAMNELTRLYRYPLWVTEQESLEDGVRYRYEQIWQPDGLYDGVTYRLSNGTTDQTSGDTGTLIFRKTRLADGAVTEEITAEIELQRMTVTVAHTEGTRRYDLRVIEGEYGADYALERIEETGSLVLDTEELRQMEADFMRLVPWTPDRAEPEVTGEEKKR